MAMMTMLGLLWMCMLAIVDDHRNIGYIEYILDTDYSSGYWILEYLVLEYSELILSTAGCPLWRGGKPSDLS